MGHDARFPSPRLSAGCGFRKETIAGGAAKSQTRRLRTALPASRKGEVRPFPDIRPAVEIGIPTTPLGDPRYHVVRHFAMSKIAGL